MKTNSKVYVIVVNQEVFTIVSLFSKIFTIFSLFNLLPLAFVHFQLVLPTESFSANFTWKFLTKMNRIFMTFQVVRPRKLNFA